MNNKKYLSIEELSNIFCMEPKEMKEFLKSRDFNLKFEDIDDLELVPYEQVQKHLRSQYFI